MKCKEGFCIWTRISRNAGGSESRPEQSRAGEDSVPPGMDIKEIGPVGGYGGTYRKMDINGISRIRKITLRHSNGIDAFKVSYIRNGREESTEMWGDGLASGKKTKFTLRENEYITSVKGYYGAVKTYGFLPTTLVKSLKFETNLGATFGPYGPQEGSPFELSAPNSQIVGFHGNIGWYIDAIGVYAKNRYKINYYYIKVAND